MNRYISCLSLLLLITGVVSAQTGYVARKISLGKAARTTSYIQVTVAGIPDTTCIGQLRIAPLTNSSKVM